MSFSVIAYIAPNYRDYKNYWVKAYEPGTTTPKSMATDSSLSVLIAKAEINKDGFIESAGGALIVPYIDGDYDLWLFPTEAEADANDTINAERVADNQSGATPSDLTAVARALNVPVESVTTDAAGQVIAKYIYSSSQQKTYAVPDDAIGKIIASVVEDALLTQGGETYILLQIESRALSFETVADMKTGILSNGFGTIDWDNITTGTRIPWLGYYAVLDGGDNNGILKRGTHTEDNGSIFSIDTDTYIEANIKGGPLNLLKFGLQAGGLDSAPIITAALLVNKHLYAPEGRYHTSDITLGVPCTIEGVRPKANTGLLGTVFYAINNVADKMFTLESEGITLKNFLCLNDFTYSLSYMIGKAGSPQTAFHTELSNITCRGNAQTHFDLPYLWQSQLKMLRAEPGAVVGFNFNTGTSLVLDSCVAYGTTGNGFSVESLVYSTLNSCGVDGCANGIDFITDNRGLTINSFGSEGVAGYTMRVSGTGNALTINSPYLDASAATTDVIQVTATSALTSVKINSLVTTSVQTPATAKFISVASSNPLVSVSDCYFSNTTREADIAAGMVAVRGGNLDVTHRTDTRGVIATIAAGASAIIANMQNATNETYVITADNSSGERYVDGKVYASYNGALNARTLGSSGITLAFSGSDVVLTNTLGSALTNVRYTINRLGDNIAS